MEVEVEQIVWLRLVVPSQFTPLPVEHDQRIAVQIGPGPTGCVWPADDAGKRSGIPGAVVDGVALRIDRWREPDSCAAVDLGRSPESLFDRLELPDDLSGLLVERVRDAALPGLIAADRELPIFAFSLDVDRAGQRAYEDMTAEDRRLDRTGGSIELSSPQLLPVSRSSAATSRALTVAKSLPQPIAGPFGPTTALP
jgi:hypothetical protein